MKKRALSKKRISFFTLAFLQLCLVLFCFCGMGKKKEIYVADEQSVRLHGGIRETDGSYYIDENMASPEDAFLSMELTGLKKGVYEVWIEYDADVMQMSRVSSEKVGYRKLYENPVSLRPANIQKEVSYRFMLLEEADDLKVEIFYNGERTFRVRDFRVVHTRQEYSMGLFLVLLFSLLTDIPLGLSVWNGQKRIGEKEKKILFGISVIFLLSCANLLTDYTHLGDDAYFHMNRMEGIAREWMIGHFPARMDSYYMYGMGYPVSIMYPEVFLWPAVLLRVTGFDLSFCMKAEIAFVNLLTVILSYVSFKNIFGSRRIGLWGSAVYTLSLYRLYNIYERVAVGEFIAMTFLPLICWGLTRVFSEKEEEVRDRKTVFLLAFGYMGVLYSHVLSMEIVTIFTVILCLLSGKRFFRKSTFYAFLKAAFLAVGLSLWYLIPFLDYSLGANLQVFEEGNPIQVLGLYLTQLFWVFPWKGEAAYMYVFGMQNVRAYGVGLALDIVFFYFIYVRAAGIGENRLQEFREYPKIKIVAVISILAMFMSLSIFPWDTISELSEGARRMVYSIQFPYRFLVIVTISLSFLGCALFAVLKQTGDKKKENGFAVLVLILTILGSGFYLNHEIQGLTWSDFREGAALGSGMIMAAEYLPVGTDTGELPYTYAVPGDGVILEEYKKENGHVELRCENSTSLKSYVECNLLYYPGYRALNGETGETLDIVSGENNALRVEILPGFSGRVMIDFVGESYWKIGDMISAVLWLGMICLGIVFCYKKKKTLR